MGSGNSSSVVVDATEAQRNMYRDMRKKDQKAIFYIHHLVTLLLTNGKKKSKEENIAKGEFDNDEIVLLIASESDGRYLVDWWYMYTGCSNHLTGNKLWLINFDYRKRTKIIYADDKYLNAKGMRNVKVKVKNGKIVLIKDVWYVYGTKRNTTSVGQLIEKGFFSYYAGQSLEVV
ncbi:uncharacterized protein LOC127103504 [Lathyrus oleraceus]|uniref:uncharacterized protein LOC127103504 n=1 Tax=Pisum sativum TaxID=3888 RepID=UPI0021D1E232|nr:uncharacterized protein LOC127103504 [Pisum sativum]